MSCLSFRMVYFNLVDPFMNIRSILPYFCLLVSLALAEIDSTAASHDPWFAYDKVLHFGVSCSIVLSTQYVLAEKMNMNENDAVPVGVVCSLGNGIIKEIWDSRQPGGFISRRDLIADMAGILVGIWIISL